jgi:hypothetical protein
MGKSKHIPEKFKFYVHASLFSDALSLCITVTMQIPLSGFSVPVSHYGTKFPSTSVCYILKIILN